MDRELALLVLILCLFVPTVTQNVSAQNSVGVRGFKSTDHIYNIQSGKNTFELNEDMYNPLISIVGLFRHDGDDKWRCYANITITNDGEENVTVLWVYSKALNITYIDETSEELGVTRNFTTYQILQPSETLKVYWTITSFGFLKEPKIIWVMLKVSLLEVEEPFTSIVLISEFPSFLILPLFMIATLLAVIAYKRRKHSM